jgi:tetratricopeptide (TPR) repeat protein
VTEKRLSRKELLKEPDEFLSTSARFVQFMQGNPRVAVASIVGCVAILVAVIGGYSYYQYLRNTGHELFERAYYEYRTLTASMEPVSQEKWDELFKRFNTLAESYSRFSSGETSLLYSGHVLYKKGDYQGALERYNKMRSTNLVEQGLEPLVMYHRGMTLVALKEYEKALVIFDSLSKNTDSPYRREAYAAIAKIYEAMAKKKEAIQAYRQYLKMFPKAPDAAFVKARIANLATQG